MKNKIFLCSVFLLILIFLLFNCHNHNIASGYEVTDIMNYCDIDEKQISGCQSSIVIIDSGVSSSADICANLLYFEDFVNNSLVPYDDNGHGTKICSILFGISDSNNCLYEGILQGYNYIVLKAADKNGHISYFSILSALQWIIDNYSSYNIGIVCCAIGFSSSYYDDPFIANLINDATSNNILFVSSAGNDGSLDSVCFPSNLNNVISVGSVDYIPNSDSLNITISSFSNRSTTKPDFYAPGENIITYYYQDTSWKKEIVSGTSFSTAIVTAQLILYKNCYADLSNEALLQLVYDNTTQGLITSVPS